MQVLITGADTPLGEAVSAGLERAGRTVRRAELPHHPGRSGGLVDAAHVASLIGGVEAIVHLEPLFLAERLDEEPPGEILDLATRGTHVLYQAAVEAGVPGAVQASTLALLDAHGEDYLVSEQWRPRPQPVAAHLAPYLAELVAREFTRDLHIERPPRVVCLRFGTFVSRGKWPALSVEDAAGAVEKALVALQSGTMQGHRWQLLHVDAPVPGARYPATQAQRAIGYGPAQAQATAASG